MTDTDALKRRASLAAVIRSYGIELTKQGSKLFAHCPFHDDSTPSFSLYSKAGIERANCKGCNWDGDVLDFIIHIERLDPRADFLKAVGILEEHIGGVAPAHQPVKQPASHKPKHKVKPGRLIATYDYTDAEDKYVIFQVLRRETLDANTGEILNQKHFSQRRPNPDGDGWIWDLKGIIRVLYRLSRVAAAEVVWIVEGEKDVATLEACGVVATTNAQGAKGHWEPQYTAALTGKHCILCGDSDAPGRERDATIAMQLYGKAASVRLIRLPEGLVKDVTEWIEAGQTVDALLEMAAEFTPPAPVTEMPPLPPPNDPPPPRITVEDNGGDWRAHLLYTHTKNPRPSIANVEIALRYAPQWRGVLGYSEFSGSVYARKPFPGCPEVPKDLPWSDHHDTMLTVWLHHEGIAVGPEIAGRAVQHVARDLPFHPVREYLEGLQWDGMPRVDTWLVEYCGVEPSHYAAAVASKWLVSAIARVMRPGCQADSCLVLEGEQGIRKSSTLKALGGEWYTNQLSDMGSKDASIQTQSVWIVEIGELDAMKRSDITRVKNFMSTSVDRYRPPYGRHAVTFPRQCIFAGTTNQETYLPDETGNRRWWPVTCQTDIQLDELAAVRDQLWAEARLRFEDGATWWMDERLLVDEAAKEQAKRYDADPWQQRIRDWLDIRDEVSVSQILEMCIAKPTKDWTHSDRVRVVKCLRADGWVRFNAVGEEGGREWRYRRSFRAREQSESLF